MGSKKRKGRRDKEPVARKPGGTLLLSVVILLLTGLGSSIYLTHLHYVVHSGTKDVESFCAISEGFNCVTVATSEYSSFLGIPVAVWGLEFYVLALLAVALSGLGLWRVRRWDSLLFIAMGLSLPACAALAWISVSCINSVCIMCLLVYGVNLLTFFVLLVTNRSRLRSLIVDGPRELFGLAFSKNGVLVWLVGAVAVFQFFWLPRLMAAEVKPIAVGAAQAWLGLPTKGLSIGPPDAPIKLAEFTDFECPYCGKAHEVMMQVIKQFPGKIHLTHHDYPLDMACHPRIRRPFHHHSCQAAYYARCAAKQEKYWPFEALVFKNREQLEHDDLEGYASQVGLDLGDLRRCIRDEATFQAVRADIEEGIRRKIEGTPTVFVNGEAVVGLRSADWWARKIGSILQGR